MSNWDKELGPYSDSREAGTQAWGWEGGTYHRNGEPGGQARGTGQPVAVVVLPLETILAGIRPSQRSYQFDFASYPSADALSGLVGRGSYPWWRRPANKKVQGILFAASALTGVVATIMGLGIWPGLGAARWGLDPRGCLCLLAAGVYILAALVYCVPRTWGAAQRRRPAWDARVMAWVLLGIGFGTCLVVGLTLVTAVAGILGLGWLVFKLLPGERERGV